jgi:hypothetical protein
MPATPGDLSLAVGDGTRRMSYVELAAARGISLPAARRLVLRHKWPKHTANDGTVRVSVPLSALEKPRKTAAPRDAASDPTSLAGDPTSDTTTARADTRSDPMPDPASDTVSRALDTLRDQLEQERHRAERAEEKATALQTELLELRVAERMAERGAAEAAELRQRLDEAATAARLARAELDGLRAELDARRTWGLRRRLRWALGPRR